MGGLKANENYGVINDELPSGLVPINQSFKNEQYGYDPTTHYTSYDVTDSEITENGMVLSLYQLAGGARTYTYKARVISEGMFSTPPVTASLMYAPEIYGRSDVQTIKIGKESQFIGKMNINKIPIVTDLLGRKEMLSAIVLFIIIGYFILRRKNVSSENAQDEQ